MEDEDEIGSWGMVACVPAAGALRRRRQQQPVGVDGEEGAAGRGDGVESEGWGAGSALLAPLAARATSPGLHR